MAKLWLDLFGTHSKHYKTARPKRGQYLESYIRRHELEGVAESGSFLELGAFSAKDSAYLRKVFPSATFFVSDLEPDILTTADGMPAFAGDIFKLPLAAKAVDLSFHSGLIVLFDDAQVSTVIQNQLDITRECAAVFGHNWYNFADHMKAFYKRVIRGDRLYRYRRFTSANLTDIATRLKGEDWTFTVEYHDNMALNFAARRNSSLLKYIATTRLFRLPCFFNEVVLVMKKKCAG